MKLPIEIFNFFALVFFVLASLLGLRRAWIAFNLDNALTGGKEISFTRYFFKYLDASVMQTVPLREKYDNKKIEINRIKLNRLTYTIYLIYLCAVILYILGQILRK